MIQRRAQLKRKKRLLPSARPIIRQGKVYKRRNAAAVAAKFRFFKESDLCQLCRKEITPDACDAHHKEKRSLGGNDEMKNLVILCRACHTHAHRETKEGAELLKTIRQSAANAWNRLAIFTRGGRRQDVGERIAEESGSIPDPAPIEESVEAADATPSSRIGDDNGKEESERQQRSDNGDAENSPASLREDHPDRP